jgi:hypothetical protein
VSEHEARLLCAGCLSAQAQRRPAAGRRRLAAAGLALAGILTAWVVFYGAARTVLLVGRRAAVEGTAAEGK